LVRGLRTREVKVVTFVKGDMFKSPAQVLTNTVNCVGVMGAGVALEFKNRYPMMFDDYKAKCDRGEVQPGQPYLWEDDSAQILNFPTKRDWRNDSVFQDIEDGLKQLANSYAAMGIQSIAMPALGCGLGGLDWSDVRALIEKHLGPLPDLDVYVYEPQIAASKKSNQHDRDASDAIVHRKISAHPNEL
jgi:O-acetyl-ADP-ribose deacetylase (regulator of RNase III)